MSVIGQIIGMGTGGLSVVYKWAAIGGVILLFGVGCFFYGKHLGDLQSKEVIAAYTAKRDQQDIDLLGVNLKTADRIVTKTIIQVKTIHDTNQQIQSAIGTVPDTSVLSLGWLRLYNLSAAGELPSPTSGVNDPTPAIKATEALSGIADNSATCLIYKQRAEAIMEFEAGVQKNIAESNKHAR